MEKSLSKRLEILKKDFSESADLTIRQFNLSDTENTPAAIVSIDGMCNKDNVTNSMILPLTKNEHKTLCEITDKKELFNYIYHHIFASPDMLIIKSYNEIITLAMSGFSIFLMDGHEEMAAVGSQGFMFRGVSEPASETVQRGSREGFVEPMRINMSLIRRRIKNPDLVFETLTLGEVSKTQICISYIKSSCDDNMVQELKNRLKRIELPTVLAAGYLVSFLEDKQKKSMYSGIGVSERPDTICGKLNEGRIAIIVDGTPAVLVVPHLFIENFQNIDDYSNSAYFATFTRILKYTAFAVSLYLPAIYVAMTYFHPEYFPSALLKNVVSAVFETPLPLVLEVLMIFFIYEIMREAGLRIPKPSGHVVGIVGALVIGDAAVSAGIIGAPTLMVVAISSICGYVVPNVQAGLTVFRLVLIIAGATMGIFGLTIASLVMLCNMCAKTSMNIPFMSPIAPFNKFSMRDVFMRQDWIEMGKTSSKINNGKMVFSGGEANE